MFRILFITMVFGNVLVANSFKQLIDKHCLECHGGKSVKGDVNLSDLNSQEAMFIHYDMLKNVYEQVKTKEMPPKKNAKITDDERKIMVNFLDSLFNKMENTASNTVGPTRVRRLTSAEYDYTVKAVTGLDLNLAKTFPTDGSGGEGFTNDSAILGVSPLHFEKYLSAAQEIAYLSEFNIDKGFSFNKQAAASKSKQELIKQINSEIRTVLKDFYPQNFTVTENLPKMMQAVNEYNKGIKNGQAIKDLAKKYGIHEILISKGIAYFSAATNKGIEERDSLKEWFNLRSKNYDDKSVTVAIESYLKAYKNALTLTESTDRNKALAAMKFVANVESIYQFTDQEVASLLNSQKKEQYMRLKTVLEVMNDGLKSRSVESFSRIVMPHLADLMLKAHRMPPENDELFQMTRAFIAATAEHGLDMAAKMFAIRTFVSMKFIFRFEKKGGKPTKINDYELANRLSYFLWSHPPDKELMDLAVKGKLSEQIVLQQQVERMLKDRKSRALADHFASEWLDFGEILHSAAPSKKLFPEFTEALAKDMFEETALSFEYMVKNNRSVLEIIDANYTFLNDRLRRHYGLGGGSSSFVKVDLDSKRRGGITTHASVLTLSSYPLRTSPVLRGNWILNALLGTPSPPPPPNVATLEDQEVIANSLPLKVQLEKHRKSPECNSCHQRIDPLGFPLENYDAIGRWRDKYKNSEIDAVGELKNGDKINGPEELKKYLIDNKELFLRNMSQKMLGYALGRKVYSYDQFLVSNMVKNSHAKKYVFSSMVLDIVNSYQFQHKN